MAKAKSASGATAAKEYKYAFEYYLSRAFRWRTPQKK